MIELSVIIINYNTKKLTEQAVESVWDTVKETSVEVIVVDNSSNPSERYRSNLPGVVLLDEVENNGFGNACNLGAAKAKGDYLLFLNSDTIVHPQALDLTVRYLKEHTDVGAVGIRTYLKDGSFDHGCKRGFPTPSASLYYFLGMDKKHPESKKYGAYRQAFLPEDQTAETDCVSGSYLMMPRAFFEEIGGFDETFFMYGEDVDLCFRVKEAGRKVVYFADASITHLKGASGLHTKSRDVIYHFHNAMKIFYRKHYKKKYNIFVTAAVYLGIWVKYRLTLFKMKCAHH